MRTALPILTLLIGLVVGGAAVFFLAPWSFAPATPTTNPESESRPTREQLLNYLDGKVIDLSDSDEKGEPKTKTHTLRREQIEAVEFTPFASRSGHDPWRQDVKLVVNTGGALYAMVIEVQNELIDQQRVFYGHRVLKTAKQ